MPVRTRMATRQHASTYFEDEDEDMTDLQPRSPDQSSSEQRLVCFDALYREK